ncbi:MAG: AraC family transcriptional regulator [Selenomonadaceae bacterium]|nr:AraC family transcriptional regulator [Selenomonadaceae bacterium]
MKEYKETYNSLAYKNNSDLSLYSAGQEICKPKHSIPPRVRPYHMIHFVSEGEGILQINQTEFNLKAGDVFLIPADKISYYEAAEKNPWCYSWINFLGIKSENYIRRLMDTSPEVYILHLGDVSKYVEIISEILKLEGSPTYLYLMGNSFLLKILSYLFSETDSAEKILKGISPADDLKFYLDMHYAEKFLLREVEKEMGFHPNYLTRLFVERYGVTPKKYLTELKLKKACTFLTETSLPVNLIANALGFEDPLAFSKKFSLFYKVSPSKFRADSSLDG